MEQTGPPRYRPNNPEPVYAPNAAYLSTLRGSRSVLFILSVALMLSSLGMFLQADRGEHWEFMSVSFAVIFFVAFWSVIAHSVIKGNIKRNVPPLHWGDYQSGALFKISLISIAVAVSVLFTVASVTHMISASLDYVVTEVKDQANS